MRESTIQTAPQQPASAIDVQTEIVYLRSRRVITASEALMGEHLFALQLSAAATDAARSDIAASWLAQLAALKAVSA